MVQDLHIHVQNLVEQRPQMAQRLAVPQDFIWMQAEDQRSKHPSHTRAIACMTLWHLLALALVLMSALLRATYLRHALLLTRYRCRNFQLMFEKIVSNLSELGPHLQTLDWAQQTSVEDPQMVTAACLCCALHCDTDLYCAAG